MKKDSLAGPIIVGLILIVLLPGALLFMVLNAMTVPDGGVLTDCVVSDYVIVGRTSDVNVDYVNAEGKTMSDVLNNAIYGKTYHIKVMNDYGCASAYQLQVPAFNLDFPLYFYQGDENWKVGNLERYTNTTLSVYNRYGKLLFETTDATEGWNGVYNGNPMPTTDYWYVVDVPELDKQFSGHFTLLRR